MGLKKKSKISGRIFFTAPYGKDKEIPAANIECGIRIDHRAGGKQKTSFLEKFYTDSDGNFSVTIELRETEDVVIEMRTQMNGAYPIKLFKYATATRQAFLSQKEHIKHGQDFSNYIININKVNNPANNELGYEKELFLRSLSIMFACKFAYQYVSKFCSLNKFPTIYYPRDIDSSYEYGKFIHICKSNHEIKSVLHECGHVIAYTLKASALAGGSHEDATNKTDETGKKLSGLHFAWNEGFAEFFAYYMLNRNSDFEKYFGTSNQRYIRPTDMTGESSEASVERFLSLATFRSDEVNKQFVTDSQFWDAIKSASPTRIDDCIKALQKKNNDRNLLGKILSMSRIAPYALEYKNNCISFTNTGTDYALTKLNKFNFYIKTSGMASSSKYSATLKDLTVSSNKCKYTIRDSKILNRLNNGEKLDVYIDGYQTDRIDSGPYTSELFSTQESSNNSSNSNSGNNTSSNDTNNNGQTTSANPTIFKLSVTVQVADEFGAGTDYKVYFKTIEKKEWSTQLNYKNVNDFERGRSRAYTVYFSQSNKYYEINIQDLKEFRLTCAFSLKSQKFIVSKVVIKDCDTGIILAESGRKVIKRDEPLVISVNPNELLKKYK